MEAFDPQIGDLIKVLATPETNMDLPEKIGKVGQIVSLNSYDAPDYPYRVDFGDEEGKATFKDGEMALLNEEEIALWKLRR